LPLYVDRHEFEGLTGETVAALHQRDVAIEAQYGVRFVTYWFSPESGHAFCLVEAPNPEAVRQVHSAAHGGIPARVIEADLRAVNQFLGRIEDPPPGGSGVDTALRTILFTDLEGSTSMTQRLGDARAMDVLRQHDTIVRDALLAWNGTEVKHTGDGIMASFVSAVDAVASAITMQRKLADQNLRVRIGLSAGEPVTDHGDLFGATVQLARRCCDSGEPGSIVVASVVRDLCIGKGFQFESLGETALKGFEEPVRLYAVMWREAPAG
jgi:class 3 adenylate cyclase